MIALRGGSASPWWPSPKRPRRPSRPSSTRRRSRGRGVPGTVRWSPCCGARACGCPSSADAGRARLDLDAGCVLVPESPRRSASPRMAPLSRGHARRCGCCCGPPHRGGTVVAGRAWPVDDAGVRQLLDRLGAPRRTLAAEDGRSSDCGRVSGRPACSGPVGGPPGSWSAPEELAQELSMDEFGRRLGEVDCTIDPPGGVFPQRPIPSSSSASPTTPRFDGGTSTSSTTRYARSSGRVPASRTSAPANPAARMTENPTIPNFPGPHPPRDRTVHAPIMADPGERNRDMGAVPSTAMKMVRVALPPPRSWHVLAFVQAVEVRLALGAVPRRHDSLQ